MTLSPKPKVLALMGPTASGKTGLAIEWVKRWPQLQIISVDSALVYRGMDIGTGKPSQEEQAVAPHRLIDIVDPIDGYSAAQFAQDALAEIDDIHRAGGVPLLVGGTMLYFQALLSGLAEMPSANVELRQRLVAEAEAKGWAYLFERLQRLDPVYAEKIHPNDGQRIQRALEVLELSGKPFSQWHLESKLCEERKELSFSLKEWVLSPANRAMLHCNIERRFDSMLDAGLVDEVARLRTQTTLHIDLPAIRSVGYRQIWRYLDGDDDLAEARAKALAATRQLAKRQLTWLRRTHGNPDFWVDMESTQSIQAATAEAGVFFDK